MIATMPRTKTKTRRGKQARPAKRAAIIRLGAYQGPTLPGQLEHNAAAALEHLEQAQHKGVHFACLPECFLTGYDGVEVLRACAISVSSRWFRAFVQRCKFGAMVSIVGFVEKRGRHFHNSAAVIQGGKLLGVYRKSIPGSKHEAKLMTWVSRFPVFKAHGVSFGVIICVEGSVPEPAMLLAHGGARIIFEPHYSFPPQELLDGQRLRIRHSRIARAVENQTWHVKANVVMPPGTTMAGEAGAAYGDSLIVDPLGNIRAEAGLFTTTWITADVDRASLTAPRPSRIGFVPKATRAQMVRAYR